MGKFIKGDVIILPFPFSDLSDNKKRPALVIASLPGDDIIVCQITSKSKSDPLALSIIAGHLNETKTSEAVNSIIKIVSS